MRTTLTPRHPRSRGFTLVELLIAMVLSMVVIGAVIAVFVANRQSYRATEGLSRVQENVRLDRKSTRLNSSHIPLSRMPSSA